MTVPASSLKISCAEEEPMSASTGHHDDHYSRITTMTTRMPPAVTIPRQWGHTPAPDPHAHRAARR